MTHYNSSLPDGENQSSSLGVSKDGIPELDKRYHLPARCGMADQVKSGQSLIIENSHGNQVCDFWAFAQENLDEFTSMEHTHSSLGSIFLKQGDGHFTKGT
jgi:uncharacterized protein YcgI (DUF1989 family)